MNLLIEREKLQNRLCPLCHTNNSQLPPHRYSSPPWLLKQCVYCSLLYLENPPELELFEEELSWEKRIKEQRETRQSKEPLFQRFSQVYKALCAALLVSNKYLQLMRRYGEPGEVLDVGCGEGEKLEAIVKQLNRTQTKAFIPYGIEISRRLSRLSHQRFSQLGGGVIQCDAINGLKQFEDNRFSSALLISFLEHEPQPALLLKQLRRKLKPGGVVIIKVPNYASWNRGIRKKNWCGFRYPEHVNYFTPNTLKVLARQYRYHVLRFGWSDHLPTSDSMYCVLKKTD